MDVNYKSTWDYKGWMLNPLSVNDPYCQKDWTQTFITKANMISAQIFQSTMFGGANGLSMNLKVFEIIKDLEYYNNLTGKVAGRYLINIDETLPNDKVYVYRRDFPIDPIINGNFVVIQSVSPNLEEYKNNPKYQIHIVTPDMLIGEITILNYE